MAEDTVMDFVTQQRSAAFTARPRYLDIVGDFNIICDGKECFICSLLLW